MTCHPDKVGEDPVAAVLFHKLSNAIEVLSNESMKRDYDLKYKAHYASIARVKSMDAARQAAREKLNNLEQQGTNQEAKRKYDLEILSKIQQEDSRGMEFLLEELKVAHAAPTNDRMEAIIKAKWEKSLQLDTSVFKNNIVKLEKVIMKDSGKGRALLIFKKVEDAVSDLQYNQKIIFIKSQKPLALKEVSFSWANGVEPVLKVPSYNYGYKSVQPMQDYEHLTLLKMRERGVIISSNRV